MGSVARLNWIGVGEARCGDIVHGGVLMFNGDGLRGV